MSHLKEYKLKELGSFINGANFTPSQLGKGDKFVNLADIYTEKDLFSTDEFERVELTNSDNYLLKDGDILFVRSSVKPSGVGFPCLFHKVSEDIVVFCGFIIRFRFDQHIVYPKYLLYLLLLSENRNKVVARGQVLANTNINQKGLGSIAVNIIKSLDEQKAIAGILSKVDEAIEAVENSIKSAERLKKSLMQNLFTGKMRPDGSWRSEDDFYEDEKFGRIPKGWHIIKGNKITDKITKGQSPKWQGFDYQDTGILFVTSENVRDGYIDVTSPKYLPVEFNDKIKNSQLSKGDVLINIVGASIGRCAVFNLDVDYANTNQAVCVFRTNSGNDSYFISFYLQTSYNQNRLLGTQVETARANLSLGDFRKFKFVIPEKKEEQEEIASVIKTVTSTVEAKINKIAKLKSLKKSLMQNLLTGKVRVDVEKVNRILEEADK